MTTRRKHSAILLLHRSVVLVADAIERLTLA
eukprot:CAMPEP_0185824126 /NCGR_PEP_ID=MMETSP1322-20130828/29187_1 /TAXON_ID=265543 /ORGANISM="Minutocellus polymorphus, Strain RCC2270" /LENGTH=30 /DNA_ID= /DNA_START= /DNA_END= /DNA_ORIENTATION=